MKNPVCQNGLAALHSTDFTDEAQREDGSKRSRSVNCHWRYVQADDGHRQGQVSASPFVIASFGESDFRRRAVSPILRA
jgi:hypothetical protein